MLCEKCGKRPATTYFKQNINGSVKEMYLCSDCAAKSGFASTAFSGFDMLFPSLIQTERNTEQKRCICGTTFPQIRKSGFVGCPECYKTFEKELSTIIKKTHGALNHVGRKPEAGKGETETADKADTVETLKEQLSKAIEKEDFEQAVILRDKIKEKENGGAAHKE